MSEKQPKRAGHLDAVGCFPRGAGRQENLKERHQHDMEGFIQGVFKWCDSPLRAKYASTDIEGEGLSWISAVPLDIDQRKVCLHT